MGTGEKAQWWSTGCSSKRTRFRSSIYAVPQHNCLTPVPREPIPFSELCRNQAQMWFTYMHAGKLPIHIHKTKTSIRQDNNKSLGCKQKLSIPRATVISEHTGFLKVMMTSTVTRQMCCLCMSSNLWSCRCSTNTVSTLHILLSSCRHQVFNRCVPTWG